MGVGKWVTCDFIFLTYTVKSTSDFSVSKCDHFSAKWRVRVSGFLNGPLAIRFWFLSAVLQIQRVSLDRKEDVIAPELNGTGNSAFMRLPPGVFGNESVYLQFLFTDLSLEILQTKSVTRWRLNPRTILGDVITGTTQNFILSQTCIVIYSVSWMQTTILFSLCFQGVYLVSIVYRNAPSLLDHDSKDPYKWVQTCFLCACACACACARVTIKTIT